MQNGQHLKKNHRWGFLPMWLVWLTLILSLCAQANHLRCQLRPAKLSMQESLVQVYHSMSPTMYRPMLLLLLFLLQLLKGKAETGLLWQCPNPNSSHQSTMVGCFLWSSLLKWWLVSEVILSPSYLLGETALKSPSQNRTAFSLYTVRMAGTRPLAYTKIKAHYVFITLKGIVTNLALMIFMPQSFFL